MNYPTPARQFDGDKRDFGQADVKLNIIGCDDLAGIRPLYR